MDLLSAACLVYVAIGFFNVMASGHWRWLFCWPYIAWRGLRELFPKEW